MAPYRFPDVFSPAASSASTPGVMICIGLFMYDHLQTHQPVDQPVCFGNPVLKPEIKRGSNILTVGQTTPVRYSPTPIAVRGSVTRTATFVAAKRLWIVEAEDIDTGKDTWQARGLVNATSPR